MNKQPADIVREYGPYPGIEKIHGVSFDGRHVWFATGAALQAMDPQDGSLVRAITIPATAGTAFDGRHLYQISEDRIKKIDAMTGAVVSTIPTPEGGCAGLAWSEGALWAAQYRKRQIHQLDPATGRILRTLQSNRFVTGVTWVDGELWHGFWEGEESALRQLDPQSGKVLQQLDLPAGTMVSGLESNGADAFYCGGGGSGKLRVVRRPRR